MEAEGDVRLLNVVETDFFLRRVFLHCAHYSTCVLLCSHAHAKQRPAQGVVRVLRVVFCERGFSYYTHHCIQRPDVSVIPIFASNSRLVLEDSLRLSIIILLQHPLSSSKPPARTHRSLGSCSGGLGRLVYNTVGSSGL